MSVPYTVVRGDTLSGIARRHGLASWRELYNHPDNADFRRRRPNPDLIFPGDVVMIPGAEPTPPEPPSPQTPLERELETFLTANRQRDAAVIVARRTELVVLAELHVGFARKSAFMGDVIRTLAQQGPARANFHASEHYIPDPAIQVAIQNFVFAADHQLTRARRHLPEMVRRFEPVLDAARRVAGHRTAVIAAGSHESDPELRHSTIHASFNASIRRHNTLHSINQIDRTSRGHFLLGSFHAARRHDQGRGTPTTTMLLVRDGWSVHVVRFTVNVVGGIAPDGTILGGESIEVEPLGGGATLDLLPALNRVAGGSPFYADIRGANSPFARVRVAGGANTPYNELFDAILHLP
jgi:hypothetical protein